MVRMTAAASTLGTRRIRSRSDLRSTGVTPRLPTTLLIDTLLPSSGLVPLGRPQPDAIFGDGADQPLKRFVRQPCGNVKTTQALVRLNFNDVLPVIPLFSRPATASPAAELSENITELHHFIAWKPARI